MLANWQRPELAELVEQGKAIWAEEIKTMQDAGFVADPKTGWMPKTPEMFALLDDARRKAREKHKPWQERRKRIAREQKDFMRDRIFVVLKTDQFEQSMDEFYINGQWCLNAEAADLFTIDEADQLIEMLDARWKEKGQSTTAARQLARPDVADWRQEAYSTWCE